MITFVTPIPNPNTHIVSGELHIVTIYSRKKISQDDKKSQSGKGSRTNTTIWTGTMTWLYIHLSGLKFSTFILTY